jgi:hypothetical protein
LAPSVGIATLDFVIRAGSIEFIINKVQIACGKKIIKFVISYLTASRRDFFFSLQI